MAVFLYDGHCVLCSKAVEYTLRHEKNPQTRFVAILSEEGRALAKDYDINPENPQSFLFIKDALAHASSDGVLELVHHVGCLLYTSPSPRDRTRSRMPSSA